MKLLKSIIFFLFVPFLMFSQNPLPPVTGSITTTDGLGINIVSQYLTLMQNTGDDTYVEIVTNIPFEQFKGMTSLYFDYSGYERVWQTKVGWYVFNNAFFQPVVSIQGEFTHDHVKLANKNGKVTIYLPKDAFAHYGHLSVNSMTRGLLPGNWMDGCLLYTSPSPRDATLSRMPSSA